MHQAYPSQHRPLRENRLKLIHCLYALSIMTSESENNMNTAPSAWPKSRWTGTSLNFQAFCRTQYVRKLLRRLRPKARQH